MLESILGVSPRPELLDFTPHHDYAYALTIEPERCDDAARKLVEILNAVLAERVEGSGTPPSRIADDLALSALFSLRARVRAFLENSNNWNAPFTDLSLPDPVGGHGADFRRLVQAVYQPLNPTTLSNTWTDHAITAGSDTLTLPAVVADYAQTANELREWDVVKEQMRFLKSLPLDMGELPTATTVRDQGKEVKGWTNVSYDPELGTRATRRIAEVKLAGHRRKLLDLPESSRQGMPLNLRNRAEARSFA